MTPSRGMKHDHRQSLWVIAGGNLIWCWKCGAWRLNMSGRQTWHKPTGLRGKNPALFWTKADIDRVYNR